MTLMEAIEHCEEKVRELGCTECAADHRQLAAWLRRLAAFEADAEFIDGLTLAKKLKAAQCEILRLRRGGKTMPDIAFHGLVPDFIEPEYQTEEAACFDIYLQSDLYLAPGEPVDLPLGFSADIEKGYSVQIYPRSSAGRNWGVFLWNGVGIIDSDFHGEWRAKLESRVPVQFRRGDRILQGLVTWGFRAGGVKCAGKKRGNGSGSTGR